MIERSVDRLRGLVRSKLRDSPRIRRWYETDDVFQAVAVRLHRALKDVTPDSVDGYFKLASRLVRRELCDLFRHEYGLEGPGAHHASGPSPGGPGGPDKSDPGAGPATRAGWRDLLRHVEESLQDVERDVFDLVHVQGLTQQEAASVLGVSVPTVKRRWRSARLSLHAVTRVHLPEL